MINLKNFGLIALVLTLCFSCSNAQNSVKQDEDLFYIGGYQLNPKTQTVSFYKMVGGTDWDGYVYEKDPKIDYAKTTLLLIGDNVYFKEYFPFPFDLSSLSVFYKDDNLMLLKDKKYLYHFNNRLQNNGAQKIDISGYKILNDYIYQNPDGKVFYLSTLNDFKLTPLDLENVDLETLKHLAGNYFYDKNGLYVFGVHSFPAPSDKYINHSEMLVKHTAGNDRIFANERYFIYENKVYGNSGNEQVQPLDIDPDKMIEVTCKSNEFSFITDGKSLYEDKNYYTTDARNSSFNVNEYLGSGVQIERIFQPNIRFIQSEKNPSEVCIVSEDIDKEAYTIPGNNLIAKIDHQYYLLFAEDHDRKPIKITKLTIYNSETNAYEALEDQHFKTFNNEGFILYKNTLYFDGMPVQTRGWNLQQLKDIPNSDYMTDGNMVFYAGNTGSISIEKVNGKDYASFSELVLPRMYSPDLKVVGRDVLFDGKNLINRGKSIALSDLKMDVRVVPELNK